MKLVLIGGDHNKDSNPSIIDLSIKSLSGKDNPNFLFIGLASKYSDSKYDQMKKIYQKLNCNCMYLKRKNLIHNPQIVIDKIQSADIIYFCGGDTIKLLEDVDSFHLEKYLKEALNRDCVLAGSSAGSILLSKMGYSDSYILRGESDQYSFVSGLGFSSISICPHYDKNTSKTKQLMNDIKGINEEIYGLEEGTAIVINDNQISYVSTPSQHVYKLSYDKKFIEELCK